MLIFFVCTRSLLRFLFVSPYVFLSLHIYFFRSLSLSVTLFSLTLSISLYWRRAPHRSHIIHIDFVENWRCEEIVKDWFRLRLVLCACVWLAVYIYNNLYIYIYIYVPPTTMYLLHPGEWWPAINWLHKKKILYRRRKPMADRTK